MERVTAAIAADPEKVAICFHVSHASSGDIILAECPVVRFFCKDSKGRCEWHQPRRPLTLKDAIDKLYRKHGKAKP